MKKKGERKLSKSDKIDYSKFRGDSNPVLDECRDVLLDKDCHAPHMTQEDLDARVAGQKKRLKILLEKTV